VGGIQRIGNLDGRRQRGLEIQRRDADALPQIAAVQEFHGDPGKAVLFADVVDGADVRVIQGGCGFRLAPKPAQRQRILRHIVGQELERDKAIEARVLRLVHHTHAARPDLGLQFVRPDRRPGTSVIVWPDYRHGPTFWQ
jgi:hypothetical protein